MKQPGLIIFDCDGVLVDSEPVAMRVLIETIHEAGGDVKLAEAYARFLGQSLETTRALLARDYGVALSDAALVGMRERLYARFRDELRPIPHVPETLAALDLPFCVASSSSLERVELSLRLTRLWPMFEGAAFSANMVEHGKPAPDLFLHAARVMGHPPETCLVVEDSAAGIRAAQAAGMAVVGFTGGGHATGDAHRSRIDALNPDRVIADMRDLVALVEAPAA